MRNSSAILAGAFIVALAAVAPAWAQGADPIAVLQSNADLQAKMEACRILQLKGDASAVPVLDPLLLDEKMAHPARYALEAMSCAEAGAALRNALAKTNGNLKVGVISSLGMRKDASAVPELVKLLAAGGDEMVVRAAALALGQIGTPEAAQALKSATAQANVSPAVLNAYCEGLLRCADASGAAGQRDAAIAAFDHLRGLANASVPVRAAALRGAALTRGANEGAPLLAEAIRGADEALFNAGLGAAREMEAGEAVSEALAKELPALPAAKKVGVIDVLGQRGGAAAGQAVLAEAQRQDAPVAVQVGAVNALARMGFSPAMEYIVRVACSAEGEVAIAAQNALAHFPGPDGDAALTAMLKGSDAKARRVAAEAIGQGGLPKPAGLLMAVVEGDADEGVRVAALKGLEDCAGNEEMPRLLACLTKAQSQPEIDAASNTFAALIARAKKTPQANIAIQKAVYGKLPDGPSADVTAQVAQIVAGGSLTIEATNNTFSDSAPGIPKQLRVEYTASGTPFSKMVSEGETLSLATASIPPAIVDALCAAQATAQGEAKIAVLRLLSDTESAKAFETVRTVAMQGDAVSKEFATRMVCEWPTADALPTVMELAANAPDPKVKAMALGGAVRLLKQGSLGAKESLERYAALLQNAGGPDDKKQVLSGLAQVASADALELVFAQFGDEAVKAEALQAAVSIAKEIGKAPREDAAIFNGKDMTGWQATTPYWKFEDGAIVGQSTGQIADSNYVWSAIEVRNFYFAADVKLEPATANSGIQFRSKKLDEAGHALGSQGDIGQGVWGRLYHQGGRGMLDWNGRAEDAVKPGDWNRYEILAVGPIVCTAINGKLGVACFDLAGKDERTGLIGFQLHAGPAAKVSYKNMKLVHDPKVEFVGMTTEQLIAELRVPQPQ